jgi:asparagine synthase (glutamine-hydrolysing)
MTGIVGKIGHGGHGSWVLEIDAMARCMRQEPGQICGHTTFAELGVSTGWITRPGASTDGLAVWNEDRTVCLIFAGEDFASRERIPELQRNGHVPPLEGAAALVHLYEEKGTQCFRELNGWFAGLLVDLRENKVILFNDRYGLGRIYYHDSPDAFLFASEAKSLLAVVPRLREIDQRSLAEFYSMGCVLQDRSLFKGVFLLPAGSQWTFHHNGRVERQRYFDPQSWEQQEPLDAHGYAEQLTDVFRRVAPLYLQGPSTVGMSLTGGLDSRMLLAWAQAAPGSLPCYTFSGPYRDSIDVCIARRLAAIAGQPHTTIRIGNDFFPKFQGLAEQTVYLTDGAMDVSGAVELYVNRTAREIAPVRLTGNYGSEILRSNIAFRPGPLNRALFTPDFCQLLDEAEETYRTESAGHRLSFIAFKQVPWHHYSRFAVERSQIVPRSPFLDNELVALAYRAPPELAMSPAPALQLIATGNRALDNVGTDRALRSRGFPVFTRLAQARQEFTAKAEYAYDYGMPQWLARIDRLLAPLRLERMFLGRHKFYHFRVWYRDQLATYLKQILLDPLSLARPCLRRNVVKQMVCDHIAGKSNHTIAIHKLLTVELTRRQLIEQLP